MPNTVFKALYKQDLIRKIESLNKIYITQTKSSQNNVIFCNQYFKY